MLDSDCVEGFIVGVINSVVVERSSPRSLHTSRGKTGQVG